MAPTTTHVATVSDLRPPSEPGALAGYDVLCPTCGIVAGSSLPGIAARYARDHASYMARKEATATTGKVCLVCGSTASTSRTTSYGRQHLCRGHAAVCTLHLLDPCQVCDSDEPAGDQCEWGTGGDPANGCDELAAREGLCDRHADAYADLMRLP